MRDHRPSSPAPFDRGFSLAPFLRASLLHVGNGVAAALREDLVQRGSLTGGEFDEDYAIARLTPGTNLLAMYALLGYRLAGRRGAMAALSAGTIIPAVITGLVALVYVRYAGLSLTSNVMQGARAGALAVLLWAIVSVLRPQVTQHGVRTFVIAAAALVMMLTVPIPQIALLIGAGGIGAVLLRREP